MGPKKSARSASASRLENSELTMDLRQQLSRKIDENDDLQANLTDALANIEKLNETVKILQTEKVGLQEIIESENEQFRRDKENLNSLYHTTQMNRDRQIQRLSNEIDELQNILQSRDVELSRLQNIALRESNQRNSRDYNVPLPNQVLFDGKTSYTAFIRQFAVLAETCQWSDKERAFRLLNSLRDDAAEFVFNQVSPETQQSYKQLEQCLAARFVERRSTASYLMELENVKLHSREKLVEYVADIKRLVRKGYPTADDHTIGTICLRHFIRGLGDSQMALAIGMKDPTSIENAREILETYYSLKDETKANTKVRMVRQGNNNVSQEQFLSFKKEIDKKFDEILSVIKKQDMQPEKFKRRDLSTVECYKCHNLGHYARDCTSQQSDKNKAEN